MHRKKELYKLLIARSDIGAAISATKLMLTTITDMGDDLYYPLLTSIVICYARPFTNNEPYGAIPSRYQRFNNHKLLEIHKKLLSTRHELIAHSDMRIRRAMIVPEGVKIGEHQGKAINSANIGTQTSTHFFAIPFFEEVHDTAMLLYGRLNEDIDYLVKELYGDMELPTVAFNLRIDDGL